MKDKEMETKQRIWDNILRVWHLNRCYATVARRMQHLYLLLSVVVIVASTLAAALLLADPLPYTKFIGAFLFFVTASVTAVMVVFDFSRRAQVARTVDALLREIDVELQRLWHQEAPDVDRIEMVEDRIDSATREDVILIGGKLSKKSFKEAFDALDSYYKEPRKATATGNFPTSEAAETYAAS